MRVLITGSQGYLGTVLAEMVDDAGHEVTGLDSCLYDGCVMGPDPADPPVLAIDLRDVRPADLVGFDAVVHLAALPGGHSTVPAGIARRINHIEAVRLAAAAKQAGVARFLFASCVMPGHARGQGGSGTAEHKAPLVLAGMKAQVEQDLAALASPDFVPVVLRLASLFGHSPRGRSDLLANRLVGDAVFTGEVAVPNGCGGPRPMVHVRDAAQAFLRCLTADPEMVGRAVFDVVGEDTTVTGDVLARMVVDEVPGSTLRARNVPATGLSDLLPEGAPTPSPSLGCVSVVSPRDRLGSGSGSGIGPGALELGQIQRAVGFEPRVGLAEGVAELHRAYVTSEMGLDTFYCNFDRGEQLRAMRRRSELNDEFRRKGVLQ